MPISEDHPDFVTAFARGLAVIRSFSREAKQLTLSEVAARTGLTRPSARRFLLTLEAMGYVVSENGTFRLMPRVLDLGYAYLSSLPLWEHAQPLMQRIVDQIDESCSMAVLDGADVVYIARVPPSHVYTIPIQVGMRMPAYVNAMGRVLLAAKSDSELESYFTNAEFRKLTPQTVVDAKKLKSTLKKVREAGFAMPQHEVYEGRASIAVPIRNRNGETVAAMNVSAMFARVSKEDFTDKFLPLLLRAANELSDKL